MLSLISGTIIRFISYIQSKETITKERCQLMSKYFFQSIGFCILLYYFLQLPLLLLRLVFQIISIIFSLPLNIIEFILPKTDKYYVLLPLFSLCSFLSYSIAKISHKNFKQQHSFIFIFIILLSLQSLFILLPIATSIQEQRTFLSLTTSDDIKDKDKLEILQISSNDEENFLLKQQEINLVNSSEQFSSKVLENLTKFIQEDTKQTNKTKFSIPSISFNQKIYIWFQTIFKFFQSQQSSLEYNISSIYSSFTDLHCYDYRKLIHQYKQNYIYFLNTYRLQSPFPIYLSIIQSNGPQCYLNHLNSSCAIYLKQSTFYLRKFSMMIIIIIIIIILISILFGIYNRKRYKPSEKLIQKKTDISTEQLSSNKHPLDEKIENKLRIWLEKEKTDGYQNLSELCRLALNTTYSKQSERFTIETLQFADAKISNASQTSTDMIVINAILDIDHLILNVIKNEHFSIKIPKLTGELEILLINNTIKIKFKHIQIDNTIIIDSNNILSFDEKESIINLLKEIITQIIVQCSFYLSDNQEKPQTSIPIIASEPSGISPQVEIPPTTSMNNNNNNNNNSNNQEQTPSENQVKRLLVRVVKAVRLHDVEQPFCILELNQPKQIHQTTIAKNGVNPFWDERFLFECNDKSNKIHLKIIDRKKSHKKLHSNIIDILYADVSIPFSYVTSTIYKQDIRITPQYPDSIIRIEFSTLTEEEALFANNGYGAETSTDSPTVSNTDQEINQIEHEHRQLPSDDVLTLTSHSKVYNTRNYSSSHSQATVNDTFSTLSPLTSADDNIPINKSRKSRSFMNSFRLFQRRKKYERKGKENENGLTSPSNISTQTNNTIPHSLSAEPFISLNSPDLTTINRQQSISRSFRNFFRSNSSKKNLIKDNNFILDHPDLLATSTPTPKKRSFFRRFKSKKKQEINFSTNSLTSDDCTRTESVRDTPIRANVGRPVTMTKPVVT